MARYSRRRGPPNTFIFPLAGADIPGLSLTRFFDTGEILVTFYGTIANSPDFTRVPTIQINLDGAISQLPAGLQTLFPVEGGIFTLVGLITITEGVHTISVFGISGSVADQMILADSGVLTVIQLPLWDRDTDIT